MQYQVHLFDSDIGWQWIDSTTHGDRDSAVMLARSTRAESGRPVAVLGSRFAYECVITDRWGILPASARLLLSSSTREEILP